MGAKFAHACEKMADTDVRPRRTTGIFRVRAAAAAAPAAVLSAAAAGDCRGRCCLFPEDAFAVHGPPRGVFFTKCGLVFEIVAHQDLGFGRALCQVETDSFRILLEHEHALAPVGREQVFFLEKLAVDLEAGVFQQATKANKVLAKGSVSRVVGEEVDVRVRSRIARV